MVNFLIVEDEKNIQNIISEYMKKGGHSCYSQLHLEKKILRNIMYFEEGIKMPLMQLPKSRSAGMKIGMHLICTF